MIRLALKHLQVVDEIMPHLAALALQEKRYSRLLKKAAKKMGIPMAVFEAIAMADAV